MAKTVQGGYYGHELTQWRKRAKLTVPEMAELLDVSEPTVYRWEADSRHIREPRVDEFLTQCGATPEEIELFKVRNSTVTESVWGTLGASTDRTSVVGALLRAEYRATRLTVNASTLVPGLLQTPGYARFTMTRDGVPEDEIATRVAERMGRAAMVRKRSEPLQFDVLMDEAVLLRPVDSVSDTIAQIKYLSDFATLPNVKFQVVPLSAGWSVMQHGQFSIYEFADGPPVAYREFHNVMMFFNDPEDVEGTYRASIEQVRPLTMSPEESKGLMLRRIQKLESLE